MEMSISVVYPGDKQDAEVTRKESLSVPERISLQRHETLEATLRWAIDHGPPALQDVVQDLYRELVLSNFTQIDGKRGSTAADALQAAYPSRGTLPGFVRHSGKVNAAGTILHNIRAHSSGESGYSALPTVLAALLHNGALSTPRCEGTPQDSGNAGERSTASLATKKTGTRNSAAAPGTAGERLDPIRVLAPAHSQKPNPNAMTRAKPVDNEPEPGPSPAYQPEELIHQPEPQSLSFSTLMNDIQKGLIKIPQFQRDFVWGKDKSAKLLDSILKGYPIGTFILWKTKEELRTIKNIGGANLPETPKGDFVQYVLDGQQRLTTLFASLRGLKVERHGRQEDFADLFIDLSATGDQELVLVDRGTLTDDSVVRVVDLLNADIEFLGAYPRHVHKKLSQYQRRLETYSFSIILVKEAPLEVATEIFTRINVTGKALSVYEIMVAKTFDAKAKFDLSERFEEVLADLRSVNYETIRPETILQAVSGILSRQCATKDILRLRKSDFIAIWPDVVKSVYAAVDYFRDSYRIPVSGLLPFTPLLVPFTYFFWRHPDKPFGDQARYLQDFFWRTSLTGRYSFGLESKLAQDLGRMESILNGRLPEYDGGVDTSADFIRANGRNFAGNRSYIKAVLSILAYNEPKSFADNSVVRISNDWLKQSNSKNYHHFFPRAFLRREGFPDAEANHVANITIVDDFMNKRLIGDSAPAKYIAKFKEGNSLLAATLDTHLIDLDGSGIWENDYRRFIEARCQRLSKEFAERIIPQAVDVSGQLIAEDATEDD